MKLKKIVFDRVPKLPGIRAGDLTSLDCDNPGPLKDWRIILRGPAMYLISPAGWTHTENRGVQRNPLGPSVVYEIPRTDVFLQWEASDAIDIETVLKGGKYESEPLGAKPALVVDAGKSILSQIPASQVGDA